MGVHCDVIGEMDKWRRMKVFAELSWSFGVQCTRWTCLFGDLFYASTRTLVSPPPDQLNSTCL